MRFSVGSFVKVFGLQHQTHLNGTMRKISDRKVYEDAVIGSTELYQLERLPKKWFRSENLTPVVFPVTWDDMHYLWQPSAKILQMIEQQRGEDQ